MAWVAGLFGWGGGSISFGVSCVVRWSFGGGVDGVLLARMGWVVHSSLVVVSCWVGCGWFVGSIRLVYHVVHWWLALAWRWLGWYWVTGGAGVAVSRVGGV